MKKNLILMALAWIAFTMFSANSAFAQTNQSGNQTDLQFLDLMTMHDEDGVKITEMAINKFTDARVKAFARKMQAGQQKDIPEMRAMRERHFANQAESRINDGQRTRDDGANDDGRVASRRAKARSRDGCRI